MLLKGEVMKKIIVLALSICGALALVGCAAPAPEPAPSPDTSESQSSQMPNPLVKVESSQALAAVGVMIDAPSSAEDVNYFTLGEDIARVDFTKEKVVYQLRASLNTDVKELTGIQGEVKEVGPVTIESPSYKVQASIYQAKEYEDPYIAGVVKFNDGTEVAVSLVPDAKVDALALEGLYKECIETILV